MASNLYAALAELRSVRRVDDTADDSTLETRLERASRAIDTRCLGDGGHFYADTVATARTYRIAGRVTRGEDGALLLVDDISSTTGLVVEVGNGTTWTTIIDYSTSPDNAIARGRPITALRRNYGYWSPYTHARVTAAWGWPSVPSNVAEATLLLANRRFMRRDSPEGVAGWSDQGPFRVSRFDSDIEDLLGSFALADGFA